MAKTVEKTATHKSTALKGKKEVNDYMKTLNHPLKKGIEVLRKIILGADKGMTEHIKWKGPSFCYAGDDRITLNLHKDDAIIIVFHLGAKVKDTKGKGNLVEDSTGLIEWVSNDRGIVKLNSSEEVIAKKEKIRNLIKLWIQAIHSKTPNE